MEFSYFLLKTSQIVYKYSMQKKKGLKGGFKK
jgi:hypothetical protein